MPLNKEQMKEYNRRYYEANRASEIHRVSERKKKNKARIDKLKQSMRCSDCGCKDDLVFHHEDPTTKIHCISWMLTYSTKKIDDELAKCRPLCRRCHNDLHNETEQ